MSPASGLDPRSCLGRHDSGQCGFAGVAFPDPAPHVVAKSLLPFLACAKVASCLVSCLITCAHAIAVVALAVGVVTARLLVDMVRGSAVVLAECQNLCWDATLVMA